MALSVFAGSFTKNTGTGAQAVTGVGFTPKILLMWTSYKTAADTVTTHVNHAWGMASGASEVYSASWASQQGVTTSNNARRGAAAMLTVVQYDQTTLAEASLTSFDADGFTLDWTTNSGGAQLIHFLAIGGTNITTAKVTTFTSPTSTGNKVVTGLGFKPDLMILARHSPLSSLALGSAAAGAQFMLGMVDRLLNQWVQYLTAEDAKATTPLFNYFPRGGGSRADICVGTRDYTGAVSDQASMQSLDSDGFTLNYTTANSAGDVVGVLAVKVDGVAMKVGTTDSNPATGVGFSPSALLWSVANSSNPSGPVPDAGNSTMNIGASTGTTAARNQSAAAIDMTPLSDGGNTVAYGLDSVTKTLSALSPGVDPPIAGQRVLTSFDADGWTTDGSLGSPLAVRYFLVLAELAGAGYIDQGEEG